MHCQVLFHPVCFYFGVIIIILCSIASTVIASFAIQDEVRDKVTEIAAMMKTLQLSVSALKWSHKHLHQTVQEVYSKISFWTDECSD